MCCFFADVIQFISAQRSIRGAFEGAFHGLRCEMTSVVTAKHGKRGHSASACRPCSDRLTPAHSWRSPLLTLDKVIASAFSHVTLEVLPCLILIE